MCSPRWGKEDSPGHRPWENGLEKNQPCEIVAPFQGWGFSESVPQGCALGFLVSLRWSDCIPIARLIFQTAHIWVAANAGNWDVARDRSARRTVGGPRDVRRTRRSRPSD